MVQAQDYTYMTISGTITITKYIGSASVVVIPEIIDGLPVTSIGDGAFSYCSNLTSVTIPNGVSWIGNEAFAGCSGLTSVAFPNNVPNIAEQVFMRCTSLTNATFGNGVTNIGWRAFAWCTNLTSIIIPESVTDIRGFAFMSCTNLAAAYFQGDAPTLPPDFMHPAPPFHNANKLTIYYLPGTAGWSSSYGYRPTAWWVLPYPVILDKNPSFGLQNNRFGFRISWATNASVLVEASIDLANAVWVPVSTNTLTDGWYDFSDPKWSHYPARFYRLRGPWSNPPVPHAAIATAQVVNGFVVGITITDPGYGYTNAPVVEFTGGGGHGAMAVASIANGMVTSITISNAGIGYTDTPQVLISSPPQASHTAVATVQVVNGFVVGITITDSGYGYANAPVVEITGGGGHGAMAVASIANGMVTSITITNAGIGYTDTPDVVIASPP